MFNIRWSALGPAECEQLRTTINTHFANAALPDMLDGIEVTELVLGNEPPIVRLLDIAPISTQLQQVLKEDARLDASERKTTTINGTAPSTSPSPSISSSPSSSSASNTASVVDPTASPSSSSSIPPTSDFCLRLQLSYHGTARITLRTALLIHFPVPRFARLPLEITIENLWFDGTAMIARYDGSMYFCFEREEHKVQSQPTSTSTSGVDLSLCPLKHVSIKSVIGSGDTRVVDTGSIESFILQQLQTLIINQALYPRFIRR